jgi:hypothetical protein
MASSGGLLKAIFMRFSATSVEPGRRQRKSYRKPSTRSANRVEASGIREWIKPLNRVIVVVALRVDPPPTPRIW